VLKILKRQHGVAGQCFSHSAVEVILLLGQFPGQP